MKKNVLALGIAAAVAGFAGSAFAVTDYVAPTATGVAPNVIPAGDALQVSTTGVGHMLVVPYFSAQNGNKTLLSLTNTDTVNGKAVKVRFRGAANSDDLYDFQVFLSPGDIWTADIHQGADGRAAIVTGDNSCTKPTNINQSFKVTRLDPNWTEDRLLTNTREGYVEIFNMGNIAPGSSLYAATKHNASGTPLCSNASGTVWTDLNLVGNNTAALNSLGLAQPTTGLMGNWTIINVPNATAWSGAATAIQAVEAASGTPGNGAVVYFPQLDATTGGALGTGVAANFTADPLLTGSGITGQAQFDLPDMSTPYVGPAVGGFGDPVFQAASLTQSLATTSINNEFWTLDAISGGTDWVFSMPTRRYSAAVNYSAKALEFTDLSTAGLGNWFTLANLTLNTTTNIACVDGISNKYWNREEGENTVALGDTSSSPGEAAPAIPGLCGETSVLSINDVNAGTAPTKVLGAEVTVNNFNLALGTPKMKAQEGWMRLGTNGLGNGLPIVGGAFMSAYNPEVSAGVAGNFSMMFPHRTSRPLP